MRGVEVQDLDQKNKNAPCLLCSACLQVKAGGLQRPALSGIFFSDLLKSARILFLLSAHRPSTVLPGGKTECDDVTRASFTTLLHPHALQQGLELSLATRASLCAWDSFACFLSVRHTAYLLPCVLCTFPCLR